MDGVDVCNGLARLPPCIYPLALKCYEHSCLSLSSHGGGYLRRKHWITVKVNRGECRSRVLEMLTVDSTDAYPKTVVSRTVDEAAIIIAAQTNAFGGRGIQSHFPRRLHLFIIHGQNIVLHFSRGDRPGSHLLSIGWSRAAGLPVLTSHQINGINSLAGGGAWWCVVRCILIEFTRATRGAHRTGLDWGECPYDKQINKEQLHVCAQGWAVWNLNSWVDLSEDNSNGMDGMGERREVRAVKLLFATQTGTYILPLSPWEISSFWRPHQVSGCAVIQTTIDLIWRVIYLQRCHIFYCKSAIRPLSTSVGKEKKRAPQESLLSAWHVYMASVRVGIASHGVLVDGIIFNRPLFWLEHHNFGGTTISISGHKAGCVHTIPWRIPRRPFVTPYMFYIYHLHCCSIPASNPCVTLFNFFQICAEHNEALNQDH